MLILVVLVIGLIVVVLALAGFRRQWGPRRMMGPGVPPPPQYRGYGQPYGYGGQPYGYGGYGPPPRQGMSAGAAGAIGAVGGGLLGYELGKLEGEQQQFHHDEMMMEHHQGEHGPYNGMDQAGWGVEQDPGFIDDPNAGWDNYGDGNWL